MQPTFKLKSSTITTAMTIGVTALVLPLLAFAINDAISLARSDRMEAVGGLETYQQQREVHLRRLQAHAQQLDPETRDKETAELDGQIQDLRHGAGVQEIGQELKIERLRKW